MDLYVCWFSSLQKSLGSGNDPMYSQFSGDCVLPDVVLELHTCHVLIFFFLFDQWYDMQPEEHCTLSSVPRRLLIFPALSGEEGTFQTNPDNWSLPNADWQHTVREERDIKPPGDSQMCLLQGDVWARVLTWATLLLKLVLKFGKTAHTSAWIPELTSSHSSAALVSEQLRLAAVLLNVWSCSILLPVLWFVLRHRTGISLTDLPFLFQSTKGKEGATSCKEGKSNFGLTASEANSLQQRQRRLQDHGKERKELLSKGSSQVFGNVIEGLGTVQQTSVRQRQMLLQGSALPF